LQVIEFGPFKGHRAEQLRLGQGVDRGDRLAGAPAGGRRALHGRGRIHVIADHDERPGPVLDLGHRAQRHHVPAAVADLQTPHVVEPHAVPGVGLDVHLPGASKQVDVVDIHPAQLDLQGVEDFVQRHAHRLALGAIDVDVQLGRIGSEGREHAGQARRLIALPHQLVRLGLEGRKAFVTAVLKHDLEAAAGSQAAHGRRLHDGTVGRLDLLGEPPPERGRDRIGPQLGRLPFLERLEDHEDVPHVRAVDAQGVGHSAVAEHVGHALGAAGDLADLRQRFVGPLQRRGIGQLDRGQQVALVLLRDEPRGHAVEAPAGQVDQPRVDHQHQQADPQRPADQPSVAGERHGEDPVEQPEEPAQQAMDDPGQGILLGVLGLQEDRAQGRAERQRVHRRQERGAGDGQGELAEEPPGNSGDEHAGEEHRGQNQADGHQRPRDFGHRLVGRGPRSQAALDVMLGGLDDHDRVIDHDADGQDQAEERERIDGEAQGGHGGERADDRHRHGDQRDQRRTPVLQEHEDHDRHQDHGVQERLEDLVDRLADVGRGVVVDAVVDPLGKLLLEFGHLGLDRVGRVQGVGAGQLGDGQTGRRVLVHVNLDVLAAGAQLDAADVAQPRDPPAAVGLDDDLGELLRIGEPPQGRHGVLEVDAAGGRRLAELPGRDLDVLFPERLDHVPDGHPPRGEACRIQPDPHAVLLLPKDARFSHAVEPGQLLDHLNRRVVAQVQLVVAPVGRVEVDEHDQVGRPLLRGHPDLPHHLGERGEGDRDAVLDEHLGHVQVRAHLERDRQRVAAVVARLGRHVQHVFHAVDLLLDRRRHGVGQHLRAGPGIRASDLHGRRRDLGVLRNGQREQSGQPDQGDHDRGH